MADMENVSDCPEITTAENGCSAVNMDCESGGKVITKSENEQISEDKVLSQKISFKMPSLPVITPKANVTTTKQTEVKIKKEQEPPVKVEVHQIKEEVAPTETQEDNKVTEKKTSSSKSKLSPAEQLKISQITIPYKEPPWSGVPNDKFCFEVLKNGTIVETVELDKPYIIIGRLPSCDVTMEHPSLSRHHAVVQYCKTPSDNHEKGWHLYDLDSTHGTWINKNKVYPQKYYRIRVGHVLKFGGSTRLFILQGPDEDREDESDLSVAEMKEQRDKQKREAEFLRQAELAEEERIREELKAKEDAKGCSWGMGEDAAEEEAEENEFSSMITPENEALYIDDPKKALKGFFEREGYDQPEYDVVETGRGKYKCCVELPIDTPTGEPIVAEAVVSGKKREAVLQCALEACRIIDKHGLLRASTHESRKRKKKNWEDDDFYDSDEDIYLDRTGDIEKKRKQRMQKAGKFDNNVETYESLVAKHTAVVNEIQEIDAKLEKAKADSAAMDSEDLDALDAYMMAIKSGVMDTKTKMKLKRQLLELKQEEQKLRRLVNVAKPAALPDLKGPSSNPQNKLGNLKDVEKAVSSFSRMKKLAAQRKPVPVPFSSPADDEDIVEEEEEEQGEPVNQSANIHGNNATDSGKDDYTNKNNSKLSENVCEKSAARNQATDKNRNSSELSANIVRGPSLPQSGDISSSSSVVKSSDSVKTDSGSKVSTEPESDRQKSGKDTVDSVVQANKQKKEQIQTKTKKLKTEFTKASASYDSADPDFAVWLPPVNQSGDGKTHLNDKYGY